MPIEKINLHNAFSRFDDHWHPRIAGEINSCQVKLVKLRGEFVWHRHEQEDEMFLVVRGSLLLRFRDGETRVNEGEMIVVPRGVEHLPVAEQEVWVMLVEPNSTLNTGNVENERTVASLERL